MDLSIDCDRFISIYVVMTRIKEDPKLVISLVITRSVPAKSISKSVFYDGPKGYKSISPADLFPFSVSPTMIGDWCLVDPAAKTTDLCCHLRLKSEPI